jgi:hypothetical protein
MYEGTNLNGGCRGALVIIKREPVWISGDQILAFRHTEDIEHKIPEHMELLHHQEMLEKAEQEGKQELSADEVDRLSGDIKFHPILENSLSGIIYQNFITEKDSKLIFDLTLSARKLAIGITPGPYELQPFMYYPEEGHPLGYFDEKFVPNWMKKPDN